MSESFEQIIDKYRAESFSERDKGDRFEKLMEAYLKTKPTYASLLSDVWLWTEFPYKSQFGTGGKDTGIDLVCRTHDGEYWAVQCKCYQKDKKVDLATVSTFITTSQYPFATKDGADKHFEHLIWIDTTYDGFNAEAENAINKIGVSRLGLIDLMNDDVDWEKLDEGLYGEKATLKKYDLRQHQKDAFEATIKYFKDHDRGKLIMACGTGKTFTSLRIAEGMATDSHLVLFLVPSIALLSQTLKEWSAQAVAPIYPICICSDAKATQKAEDQISDLVLPATTDAEKVHNQFINFRTRQKTEGGMIVVFSTYQSIDVIGSVQKQINSLEKNSFIFDLIVCDEAHRTTGIKAKDKDESAFTKVHSDENVKARKRLYMTATPRLYSSDAQKKAQEKEVLVWSMDDPQMYGEEIYRISFGAAVEKQLLSDYKVIVLTLDDTSVDSDLVEKITDEHSEIKADDAIKLIGCINVLSKRTNFLTDKELFSDVDPDPMKSAVAFCSNIANSKYLKEAFNVCQKAYYEKMTEDERSELVVVNADHVDGSMGSVVREEKLDWLKKADSNKKECRVLNNVRCLSEGVDVPSLDAIMFLSSRNSQVDVVQSVGRVMRRAEGKKFGYIIIPVVVPASSNADEILDDSEDFKIVWSVLNALRAHDDRFNATINKIELNKKKPKPIRVTGGGHFTGEPVVGGDDDTEPVQGTLPFDELQQKLYDRFEQLKDKVFAKMVNKCGSRRYWADWGKDVGEIAKRNIERINKLIAENGVHKEKFNAYWDGLKKNLNPSVSQSDAVEMLAQHMITKPVFEALFGNDHFTKENPVSKSLEEIVSLLDEKSDPEDLEKLERFYKSVQERAEGIDNAESKQKVVKELYDSFFQNAFSKLRAKLGIVYTPVEVVDFIIHSTEYVLKKQFGRSISDEKVNVIDPFTGTGTFITRLLQSGIIRPEDLKRKYTQEIFANEIVLLAYYIASVNIENVYHDLSKEQSYTPFNGICLTDTFQLYENLEQTLDDTVFEENSERANEQKKKQITVIVGNPPYSAKQDDVIQDAKNNYYDKLNTKINDTYVANSSRHMVNAVYDSYFKAYRWATDRLNQTDGGVIAFVSNGDWIDGNAQDGFRKTIEKEFNSIYVFNLRGNCRTSGELRKKEAGNVFGVGSRTPIAIVILVKKPNKAEKTEIFYYDIGDYLGEKDKLKVIKDFGDVSKLPLSRIEPNSHGDWISKRSDSYSSFISISDEKNSVFTINSSGVKSNRMWWTSNSSKQSLLANLNKSLLFYNEVLNSVKSVDSIEIKDLPDEPKKIKWDSKVIDKIQKKQKLSLVPENVKETNFRPFFKQYCYLDNVMCWSMYKIPSLYPNNKKTRSIVITKDTSSFSCLMTDLSFDYQFFHNGVSFPITWYEKLIPAQDSLFEDLDNQYIKHEGISDFILERAQSKYGNEVQRENIFNYVYGILHSKSYREKFSADLKKMLPRIPLVSDYNNFWIFSNAGCDLAKLHLDYENVVPCPDVKVTGDDKNDFTVQQMKFPKKVDKRTIIYNSNITISDIPEKAYEYVVNGKSAIEWLMERYAITTDSRSGIINDPNDWAKEHNKPRYILDLLLSVINVSVQTVDIINSLPKIDWDKE